MVAIDSSNPFANEPDQQPDVLIGSSSTPIRHGDSSGYGALSDDEQWDASNQHVSLFDDELPAIFDQPILDSTGFAIAAIHLILLLVVFLFVGLSRAVPTFAYVFVTRMEAYYMAWTVVTAVLLSLLVLYLFQFNVPIIVWGGGVTTILIVDLIYSVFKGPWFRTVIWTVFCIFLLLVLWVVFNTQSLFWSPAVKQTTLMAFRSKLPSTVCICVLGVVQAVVLSKLFYAAFVQLQVYNHGHGFGYYIIAAFLLYSYIASQDTIFVFIRAITSGAAAGYWVAPNFPNATLRSTTRALTTASGSLLTLGQRLTIFHILHIIRSAAQRFVLYATTQPEYTLIASVSPHVEQVYQWLSHVVTWHTFSEVRVMLYNESLRRSSITSQDNVQKRHPNWDVVLGGDTSTLFLRCQMFFIVFFASRLASIFVNFSSWYNTPDSSFVRAYWMNLFLAYSVARSIFVPLIATLDATSAVFTIEPQVFAINDGVAYSILETASRDELTNLGFLEPFVSPEIPGGAAGNNGQQQSPSSPQQQQQQQQPIDAPESPYADILVTSQVSSDPHASDYQGAGYQDL